MTKGPLIIVSGPSGSGKSTVIERLLTEENCGPYRLHLSVSATTRAPRPGEIDGKHYHFWTPERFAAAVQAGEFLEWAEVHGARYGTLHVEVDGYRDQGIGVILEIDVQGAASVRKQCADQVSVFLRASSLAAYEERLRKRGTESEDAIRRRVAAAQRELARASEYDHQVINDDLDSAVAELKAIVERQFQGGNHAG
jgi:guanylate kinase